MNAIQMLDQPMRMEAMAYCDRFDIRESEECERVRRFLCHRAFMRDIEPWQRLKLRALEAELMFPLHVVHADGRLERVYPPRTPELQQLVAQLDEAIALEAAKYGFTWPVGELPQESRKELASGS